MKTTRWPYRVFSFLLVVTEVNCRLVLTNLYNQPECSQQEFRKQLSRELLQNKHQLQYWSQRTRKLRKINQSDHCLLSLPKSCTFQKTSIVYRKTAYIQLVCSGCGNHSIRTYCPYSPEKIICTSCFADHIYFFGKLESSMHYIHDFAIWSFYGFYDEI